MAISIEDFKRKSPIGAWKLIALDRNAEQSIKMQEHKPIRRVWIRGYRYALLIEREPLRVLV
jgi:hypothetical protein